MKVAVTGATGLIGRRLVPELLARGEQVTVLARDPERAGQTLGPAVETAAWDALGGPAPAAALAGSDAVVHLAGEPIAQRWSEQAKRRIHSSRDEGTRNLVAGIEAAEPRPRVLVSASGSGYYGPRGDEVVDESTGPGADFVAEVVKAWEREAMRATNLGLRVACLRMGVVLATGGGAIAKMLTPFRLGVGGPVAGGRQYLPWIDLDDVVGMYGAALEDGRWSGAINASAPEPVTNARFSKALGRALGRPALLPVPGLALRLLYGEMAELVTTGVRMVPKRATELGYRFRRPDLDAALREATGRGR